MTPHKRLATIACAVLLFGGLAVQGSGPGTRERERETETARYARLHSKLIEHNPRLDAALSARIMDSVMRCERKQALPADLVLAVMLKESGGRPHVRSYAGAVGLMQVMPHMFQELGLPGSLTHIETNVEAGCMLLADNIRRLGEDRGVSAYYWGSGIRDDRYLKDVRRLLEFLALHEDGPDRERDNA